MINRPCQPGRKMYPVKFINSRPVIFISHFRQVVSIIKHLCIATLSGLFKLRGVISPPVAADINKIIEFVRSLGQQRVLTFTKLRDKFVIDLKVIQFLFNYQLVLKRTFKGLLT